MIINDTPKIFIEYLDKNYITRIQEGFSFVNMAAKIGTGDTVFIKPNLTFPRYRQGVMTSPECIESLLKSLYT